MQHAVPPARRRKVPALKHPVSQPDHFAYAIARTSLRQRACRWIERLGSCRPIRFERPPRADPRSARVKRYQRGRPGATLPRFVARRGASHNYGFLPRGANPDAPAHAAQAWNAKQRRRAREPVRIRAGARRGPSAQSRRTSRMARHELWGASRAPPPLARCMALSRMLRVARGESGSDLRRVQAEAESRFDRQPPRSRGSLVDGSCSLCAGPRPILVSLIMRLRFAVPQWKAELKAAIVRAKQRLARVQVDGVEYYLPSDERPASSRHQTDERVRLLAPFDPLVWDRRRFELLWGWAYRFEAYTPAPKRKLGYYALPLLFRDRWIGWANVTGVRQGHARHSLGSWPAAARAGIRARAGGRARAPANFLGHESPWPTGRVDHSALRLERLFEQRVPGCRAARPSASDCRSRGRLAEELIAGERGGVLRRRKLR